MDLEGTNEDTGSSISAQELFDSLPNSMSLDQKLDTLLIADNLVRTSSNKKKIAQNTKRIAVINQSKWVILIIIYTFNLID